MPEVITTKPARRQPHKPEKPKKRNLWEHLEKLRWHLIRSLTVITLFSILAFVNRHFIFDTLLLSPRNAGFPTNVFLCNIGKLLDVESLCFNTHALKIINVSMSGQFLTHLYISFIAGAIAAFPYVLFEIWRYVAGVFRIRTTKAAFLPVLGGTLLFIAGVLFSYFLIVPLTVNFLGTYHVSSDVQNSITLSSYIGTISSLVLGVGIVFELPVVMYILARQGLVTPKFLREKRKYTIVILLTLSAIITPPDIISQIMVCLPLLLLYEISIFVASLATGKFQKAAD